MPQRRQKRAVADSGRPQLKQADTPVSGRLRRSRVDSAQTASAPRVRLAAGTGVGHDGVSGHCGSLPVGGGGLV